MEGRVDLEGGWKLKTESHGIDDLLELKWSSVPGCQLPRVHMDGQVSSGQPNLMSPLIVWSWNPVSVWQLPIPECRVRQDSFGVSPYLVIATKVGLDQW